MKNGNETDGLFSITGIDYAIFSTCGSAPYDTWLWLDNSSGVTTCACDDCGDCGSQTELECRMNQFETYTLHVGGYGFSEGEFMLSVNGCNPIYFRL